MIQISIQFFLEVKKKFVPLVKLRYCEKTTKYEKSLPVHLFWNLLSNFKTRGRFSWNTIFKKNIEELHDWKVNVKFKGRQFSN